MNRHVRFSYAGKARAKSRTRKKEPPPDPGGREGAGLGLCFGSMPCMQVSHHRWFQIREVDESLSTVLDGQIGARGSVFRLYVDSEFRLLDQ